MVIAVDIDGVLCEEDKSNTDYLVRKPLFEGIILVSLLKLKGFKIKLFTARFEEDRDLTKKWLDLHGIEYDELIMGKPQYDFILDDRAVDVKSLLYKVSSTQDFIEESELGGRREREKME